MAGRGGGRRAHRKPRGNQWQIGSQKHVREGRHMQAGSDSAGVARGAGSRRKVPLPSPPYCIIYSPPSPQLARGPMTTCARCTASVPPMFNPLCPRLSLSLLPVFGSLRLCVSIVAACIRLTASHRIGSSILMLCCVNRSHRTRYAAVSTIDRSLCLCSMPMFICM